MASNKGTSGRKGLKKTSKQTILRATPPGGGVEKSKHNSSRSTRTIKTNLSFAFAILLIVFGAGLIFWSSVQNGFYISKLKTNQLAPVEPDQTVEVNSKPVKIYIARLAKTLDISEGFIENNRWKVSTTGVSYLTTSGEVGKVGNAVIYGHNTQGVLGGLWKVQNGDFIEVTDASSKVYKYEIFERKEVKPNAVEILTQTDDARLTIYTCSGFLDSARFVVVGRLVSGI
ncbi:hypothetical protein A3A60_02925 [Candidatus Curtissbacteria bacterium RIFCSPLOWO2_01_FULL_42_26]|uniref:Sortase n=1 Tax=Candidatus Curtissbacteria bacterium RIFCSPLOWO2_01_FULL_42_26 TaxID=1797729 RepID=A0A1F5I2Z7_9BACT|nr:MAG: hypothetical protein A3A60_02925 [Candidatus Curtissbacteria bacterium RIFCSPLOWO2_01_FULL_42_26]